MKLKSDREQASLFENGVAANKAIVRELGRSSKANKVLRGVAKDDKTITKEEIYDSFAHILPRSKRYRFWLGLTKLNK